MLTELQRPQKDDLYHTLRRSATEMYKLMDQWSALAEAINFYESGDLDAMGVPTGQIRTDMVNYRTVIMELLGFFKGESTSQTHVPKTIINKIRSLS